MAYSTSHGLFSTCLSGLISSTSHLALSALGFYSPSSYENSCLRTIAKLVPSALQALFPNFIHLISTYFSELILNNSSSENVSKPPDSSVLPPAPYHSSLHRAYPSLWLSIWSLFIFPLHRHMSSLRAEIMFVILNNNAMYLIQDLSFGMIGTKKQQEWKQILNKWVCDSSIATQLLRKKSLLGQKLLMFLIFILVVRMIRTRTWILAHFLSPERKHWSGKMPNALLLSLPVNSFLCVGR